MASDLVDSDSGSEASRPKAVDPPRPRARPKVWPGRRAVFDIVAPDRGGTGGAECLPLGRPQSPASGGPSVLLATTRRRLCPHRGSGTTEARPPANCLTLLYFMGHPGVMARPLPNLARDSRSSIT
jgi:hypothetical protein